MCRHNIVDFPLIRRFRLFRVLVILKRFCEIKSKCLPSYCLFNLPVPSSPSSSLILLFVLDCVCLLSLPDPSVYFNPGYGQVQPVLISFFALPIRPPSALLPFIPPAIDSSPKRFGTFRYPFGYWRNWFICKMADFEFEDSLQISLLIIEGTLITSSLDWGVFLRRQMNPN